MQRPSSFRPPLRAGGPRTQGAEAFLFPPLSAGRWPAHPGGTDAFLFPPLSAGRWPAHLGCRGLPLSAPPCGPVARAPRMQRPSSLRPSLRAGGPRTQGVQRPSFLRPSLRAGGPRTQGVPMPSSLRPSLRAGDPRTQGVPMPSSFRPPCGPVARAPRDSC